MKRRNDNHSPGPVIRELVPNDEMLKVSSMEKQMVKCNLNGR